MLKHSHSLGIFLLTLHKEALYKWTEPSERSLQDNLREDYEPAIEILRDKLGLIQEDPTKFSKWSLTQAGVDHLKESGVCEDTKCTQLDTNPRTHLVQPSTD